MSGKIIDFNSHKKETKDEACGRLRGPLFDSALKGDVTTFVDILCEIERICYVAGLKAGRIAIRSY